MSCGFLLQKRFKSPCAPGQLVQLHAKNGEDAIYTAQQMANVLNSHMPSKPKTVPELILHYCKDNVDLETVVCVRFLLILVEDDQERVVGSVEAAWFPGFDKFRPYKAMASPNQQG